MPEKARKTVIVAAVIVAAACFGFVAWHLISTHLASGRVEKVREDVRPEITLEDVMDQEFTGERQGNGSPIPEDVLTDAKDHPVDFDKLVKYNQELYAWIRIPGTAVDYPVAQHQGEDQEHYLYHDLYNKPQFSGCIYTEKPAAMDFTDPVTILYGHNMADGSMFAGLRRFLDAGFFDENRYLYIYTKGKTRIYEIVSAYHYDDRYLPASFDFSGEKGLRDYQESVLNPRDLNAQKHDGMTLESTDKLVTLSTCIGGDVSARLLVQAVLKYDEDTP